MDLALSVLDYQRRMGCPLLDHRDSAGSEMLDMAEWSEEAH